MKNLFIILFVLGSVVCYGQKTTYVFDYDEKEEIIKRSPDNLDKWQAKYPTESTCARCALPWSACTAKVIDVNDDVAVYAICTFCWDHSDLDERLTFHKALYYHHKQIGEDGEYTLIELMRVVSVLKP